MNDTHLTVTLYSRHFSTTSMSPKGKQVCLAFAAKLIQYGYVPDRGVLKRTPMRVFAASTVERDEFRFHINCLKEFKEHLVFNYCDERMVKYVVEPMYEPQAVEFIVKDQWVARDYQEPIIEWLSDRDIHNKLLTLQTGKGKGFCSLKAIANLAQRVVIIIKPMYIEKWQIEIQSIYDIDKDDILVVQGGAQLLGLLAMADEGRLTEKIIIISNKTYQNWLKLYEKFKDETLDLGYPILPHELCKEVKAGIRLIDEVHQDYHLCFKADLYTHVPTCIALSATVVSNDQFIERMHTLAYPMVDRFKTGPLDKYVNSYSMLYRFNKPEHIRTTEFGSKNFSMNAVEKSIMKHVPTMNRYCELIDFTIQMSYVKCDRKKKRMLIFAYSIEFISKLVDFLQRKYPGYDVRKYTAEDDYANIMEADICVSTLGSSGTAIDIPDLTTVILTTIVDSVQSNIQSLGRLRKLSDGTPTEFYYFVCQDIPKSLEYHGRKKTLLAERALSFREYSSGFVL